MKSFAISASILFTYSLVGLTVVWSSHAFAGKTNRTKTYIPISADCASDLQKLALKFESQSGAKVVATSCLPLEPELALQPVALIYAAARELRPNTVIFGYDLGVNDTASSGNSIGAYLTQMDCEADQSAQITLFKMETGADVFTSYCGRDQLRSAYLLKIETYQKLQKHLLVQMAAFSAPNDFDLQRLSKFIENFGVVIARSSERSVYFYDDVASGVSKKVHYSKDIAGTYANHDECLSQLMTVTQLIATVSSTSIAICTDGLSSQIEVIDSRKLQVGFRVLSSSYASVAECMADSARVISQAKFDSKNIVGGYCTYEGSEPNNPYAVQLVYKK